jgi:RNA polymerase sigma factor (sigma-70 family)
MIKREKLLSLVTKAQQGDPDAMNELISECYKGLYYFALKTVGDAELAADATQDACMEIFSTIGNLREPLGFINWARRIVYHRCLRNKKIETRLPTVQEDEDFPIADRAFDENATASPEELYEHQELCETVRTLLESLPEEQRAALLLYYHENLSVKEIAEIQSISEGTVKSRLNYGRQGVKKKVEEYEERTGTKLHAIIGKTDVYTNTFHHQAVKAVAPTLVASAYAEDGTVEAVEATDYPFLLAVQWHPEMFYHENDEAKCIFEAFLAAAEA